MTAHLVRIFYGLLLAAGTGGLWIMSPDQSEPVALVLIALVLHTPLLIFLPAVVRGDTRMLVWLCLVLMFYFCWFVVQAFYPPPLRWLALLQLAALTGLFAAASVAIYRDRRR